MNRLANRMKEHKKKEKLKLEEWNILVEGLNEYNKTNPYIKIAAKINSTHITTLSFKLNYKCTLRKYNLTHVFLIDNDHIFIDEGLTPCLNDSIFIYCERGLKK